MRALGAGGGAGIMIFLVILMTAQEIQVGAQEIQVVGGGGGLESDFVSECSYQKRSCFMADNFGVQ